MRAESVQPLPLKTTTLGPSGRKTDRLHKTYPLPPARTSKTFPMRVVCVYLRYSPTRVALAKWCKMDYNRLIRFPDVEAYRNCLLHLPFDRELYISEILELIVEVEKRINWQALSNLSQ
jgi:hypothetical protein